MIYEVITLLKINNNYLNNIHKSLLILFFTGDYSFKNRILICCIVLALLEMINFKRPNDITYTRDHQLMFLTSHIANSKSFSGPSKFNEHIIKLKVF